MKALYSVVALLISALVVQTLYQTVIRPQAEAILAQTGPTRNLRSPFVILKDYEQETALILACWALALIGQQAHAVTLNRRLLAKQYVEVGDGHVVLPDDARAYARPLESLPAEEQDMLLPRAL